MAIPWTDDTIQDRAQLSSGTDELDTQSTFTYFNFVSQSISADELRNQCNTNKQNDDSFIETTHSRVFELQRENMELKSKLNCFICKQNQFTHVLIPCSHVVCGDCVKFTICSCSIHIESSHPCTLPSIPHTTEQKCRFSHPAVHRTYFQLTSIPRRTIRNELMVSKIEKHRLCLTI